MRINKMQIISTGVWLAIVGATLYLVLETSLPTWAQVLLGFGIMLTFGSCYKTVPRYIKERRQVTDLRIKLLPRDYMVVYIKPEDLLILPVINVIFACSLLVCFLSFIVGNCLLFCLLKAWDFLKARR